MSPFEVAVFGFEGVEFGPVFVGEGLFSGEFIQPGADLREPQFDLLLVSHRNSLTAYIYERYGGLFNGSR